MFLPAETYSVTHNYQIFNLYLRSPSTIQGGGVREGCVFEGTTELSFERLVRVNQVNRREGDMQAVGVAERIPNKINHTCLVGRGSSGDRMKSEKLQA